MTTRCFHVLRKDISQSPWASGKLCEKSCILVQWMQNFWFCPFIYTFLHDVGVCLKKKHLMAMANDLCMGLECHSTFQLQPRLH